MPTQTQTQTQNISARSFNELRDRCILANITFKKPMPPKRPLREADSSSILCWYLKMWLRGNL